MGNWKRVKIAELAAPGKNSLATGPFGSSISSRFFRNSGIPVVRGSNLSLDVGRRLIEEDIIFVDEEKAAEFPRSVATHGDLIFTCWGTIGQIGLIDDNAKFKKYIISNKQMKLSPNPDITDSLFLYYALSAPSAVSEVQNSSIGSSVPGFNLTQLRQVSVPCPPLREQQRIAALLGALDSKIAVNERLATKAEELIRELFSHERWTERTPLDTLCTLRKTQVRPTEITERVVAHFSLPAYDADRLPEYTSPDTIKSVKFSIQKPSVLLSKLNPHIRRVWNIAPQCEIPALASTEFLVLEPSSGVRPSALWAVTSQQEFLDSLASQATGTSNSHQRVRPGEVMKAEVIDPRACHSASEQGETLSHRAARARAENRSLAALRDTLLPKLISGELRIRDAEKQVEEAV